MRLEGPIKLMPEWLMDIRPDAAIKLYEKLSEHADESGPARVSLATLASEIRRSERQTRNLLKILIRESCIIRDHHGRYAIREKIRIVPCWPMCEHRRREVLS